MHADSVGRATLIVYLGTLALFAVGIFFPQSRIWGVSHWAYLPVFVIVPVFLLLGAVCPVVALRSNRSKREPGEDPDTGPYLFYCLGAMVVFCCGFYFLRTQLHFLGDGYTLLANIASDDPIIKNRNFGEAVAHVLVYSILPGDSAWRALTAYRAVSIGGGVIFITSVLIASRFLFQSNAQRILFSLGLMSGGYMLLFFGYAEHYSLFVASVAVFSLVGLLIASGRINRFWILLPFVAATVLHVFGVFLIPGAVYLMVRGTGTAGAWQSQSRGVKLALTGIVVVIAGVLFYRFYQSDYFFRFAFVPIVHDRFTVEGYTLFSAAHLVDILNLLLLLFPGLLVVSIFVLASRKALPLKDGSVTFLSVLLVTGLGAVSLLDPKLGMPRDWDLFSFAGVPLVMLGVYLVVTNISRLKHAVVVATMVISLGFLSLIPRVVCQAFPDMGMAQIYDYARIDMKKSIFLFQQIHDYYWQKGQMERSPLLSFPYERQFPEWTLTNTGLELRKQGRPAEAAELLKQAIAHHPTFPPAYCNLGSCYLEMNRPDSALEILRIANGLNPYRVQTLSELGYAYMWEENSQQAEKCWRRAVSIDSDYIPAYQQLLGLYSMRGEEDKYCEMLLKAVECPGAPSSMYMKLGDFHMSHGAPSKAEAAYRLALQKGTTPEETKAIVAAFPKLAP